MPIIWTCVSLSYDWEFLLFRACSFSGAFLKKRASSPPLKSLICYCTLLKVASVESLIRLITGACWLVGSVEMTTSINFSKSSMSVTCNKRKFVKFYCQGCSSTKKGHSNSLTLSIWFYISEENSSIDPLLITWGNPILGAPNSASAGPDRSGLRPPGGPSSSHISSICFFGFVLPLTFWRAAAFAFWLLPLYGDVLPFTDCPFALGLLRGLADEPSRLAILAWSSDDLGASEESSLPGCST